MWDFPQAFLNGFDRGGCGVRSTFAQSPLPLSTSISCHQFSGICLAPDPWFLFPSTPFGALIHHVHMYIYLNKRYIANENQLSTEKSLRMPTYKLSGNADRTVGRINMEKEKLLDFFWVDEEVEEEQQHQPTYVWRLMPAVQLPATGPSWRYSPSLTKVQK